MVDLVPRLSLHCHIFCLCSPLFGNKDGVLVQDRTIKCAYMDQNRDKRAIKSDRGIKGMYFGDRLSIPWPGHRPSLVPV